MKKITIWAGLLVLAANSAMTMTQLNSHLEKDGSGVSTVENLDLEEKKN